MKTAFPLTFFFPFSRDPLILIYKKEAMYYSDLYAFTESGSKKSNYNTVKAYY